MGSVAEAPVPQPEHHLSGSTEQCSRCVRARMRAAAMGTARHGSGSAAPSAAAHRLRLLVALIALANAAVSVSKCWAMLEQVQQRMPPMFLHYTGFAGLNNQVGLFGTRLSEHCWVWHVLSPWGGR